VGLPYFVLSSTGPLVQAWFARSFEGRTPYRLYALSNVGSLLALLSYPFFFERVLSVHTQATLWSAGFVVYAVLCGYAAMSLWVAFRAGDNAAPASAIAAPPPPSAKTVPPPLPSRPAWWHRFVWLALPALASMTLLSTTNHVCADMAVIPFLWVIPLSLYLLTFIVAFDRPSWFVPVAWAIPVLTAIYLLTMIDRKHIGTLNNLYEWGTLGSIIRWSLELVVRWTHGAEAKITRPPQFAINFPYYLALAFTTMFGICMLCHG